MPLLANAKKIITSYQFQPATLDLMKELEEYADCEYYDGNYTRQFESLTSQVLADSLHYFIGISKTKSMGSALPPGASKSGGVPHLPRGMECPAGYSFYAQLNIAGFKAFDIENEFPSNGIIYFFDNTNGESEDFKLLFYDGPLQELEINETAVNYGAVYSLQYTPQAICYLTDYAEILTILPTELKTKIEVSLGCKLTAEDKSRRLFGRPTYWQNEDCPPDDWPGTTHLENLLHSISPFAKQDPVTRNKQSPQGGILLLQDDYADGSIHFWISPRELKQKLFDKVWITYSGT